MTNTLSALQEIIYAKVPELLTTCNQCKKGKFVGVCGRCKGTQNIPNPIQLHDVLRAIEFAFVSLDKGDLRIEDPDDLGSIVYWNLALGLDGQKTEVHIFLLNLLT